jgi:hypothetical protein
MGEPRHQRMSRQCLRLPGSVWLSMVLALGSDVPPTSHGDLARGPVAALFCWVSMWLRLGNQRAPVVRQSSDSLTVAERRRV